MRLHALLICVLLTTPPVARGGGFDRETCTYNGIPLYGKVQIVNSFADIKVEVRNLIADLKVEKVSAFGNDCGEWEIVDSFPDFTVELSSFGDFSITWVNSFPGVW